MPNFLPDTGGRRWSLVLVSSSFALRAAGRGWHCFPHLHCSGSRLLYIEGALRCARFQPSGPPQKCGLGCACVLCLPRPRGSGSQELEGALSPVRRAFSPPRSQPQFLPASRVRAPSPLRVPSPSPRRRRLGARALCLAATLPAISTIQNLRKSLVRNWRPVCSVVGDAVLGAEPAPFPSPLPPASGVAGPVCSRLAPLDLLGPFVL